MAINRLNPDYPDAGIVQLMPSSVAVGSGSSTVNGNGQVSFSGASSVSINGCFTSTYDRYLIAITGTSNGSNGDATFRLRASGSDISSANYARGYIYNTSGGAAGAATQTAQTSSWWSYHSGSDFKFSARIEMIDPFLSSPTLIISNSANKYAANSAYGSQYNNILDTTASYDSVTFFTPSTNMTGTISIYGIRN